MGYERILKRTFIVFKNKTALHPYTQLTVKASERKNVVLVTGGCGFVKRPQDDPTAHVGDITCLASLSKEGTRAIMGDVRTQTGAKFKSNFELGSKHRGKVPEG